MTDTPSPPEPLADDAADAQPSTETSSGRRRAGLVRRVALRPRKVLVRIHRWLGLGMFAWFLVIGTTGAWLAVHHSVEGWIHSDRYATTPGDVGPDAAIASAEGAMPDDASVYGVALPRNGRGVYLAFGELAPPAPDDEGAPVPETEYLTAFVDPGSGAVNDLASDSEGATAWLYRGHQYLWQDHGIFGAFDPDDGWCRAVDGHEPGGIKGIACDVLPDGMDMVAWFAVGFLVVLLSGFYLWYWPGVRRWATALLIRRGRGRFALHLSVHKVVGIVVWAPLLAVAFTGAAFAFPNLGAWYDNATPAQRNYLLWTHPEDLSSGEPEGREPIGYDRAAAIYRERYPSRAVNNIYGPGDDEAGMYEAWVSRGFDPWTREGIAGNTLVILDQYSGETLYDGTPSEGNVFDQAWDDWSFPLHTGDFGGTVTRVLWVGVGLSPILLGATGLTMNLIRRRKRARRRPDETMAANA